MLLLSDLKVADWAIHNHFQGAFLNISTLNDRFVKPKSKASNYAALPFTDKGDRPGKLLIASVLKVEVAGRQNEIKIVALLQIRQGIKNISSVDTANFIGARVDQPALQVSVEMVQDVDAFVALVDLTGRQRHVLTG